MTKKPTHIRITRARSRCLTAGKVYPVTSWKGSYPGVTNDRGQKWWELYTSEWEPAEPPAAFATERAAATDPLADIYRSLSPCDLCEGHCDSAQMRLCPGRRSPPPAPAGYPDDNPKTVQGLAKPGLRSVPPVALLELGRVMQHGAAKYGRFNYRANRITASTYYDAAMRHLMAWHDGQDTDPESGLPHLAHVMACCGIALDSASLGMLNDDRTPGLFAEYVQRHTAEIPK